MRAPTIIRQPITSPTGGSGDDELIHVTVCHDDYRAICGKRLPGDWVDENTVGLECIVCVDLEFVPCGCGCGCCNEED